MRAVRMRAARALVATLALLGCLTPRTGEAQASCQFTLGFATLRQMAGPAVIGDCLANERFNVSNGNAEQPTTNGLLVWRKADNWTAFTNGYETYLNGPGGLQKRLNTERFSWEADAAAFPLVRGSGAVAPPPTPASLSRAIDLLASSPLGDLGALIRSAGIVVSFENINSVASWSPRLNRIAVSDRYASASVQALAATLAHEATHAQDFYRGLADRTAADCYDREIHAFTNQAHFWRWLYGPGGKATPADRLERELNSVLRLTTESPLSFIGDLLELYQEQCEVTPPTPTPRPAPTATPRPIPTSTTRPLPTVPKPRLIEILLPASVVSQVVGRISLTQTFTELASRDWPGGALAGWQVNLSSQYYFVWQAIAEFQGPASSVVGTNVDAFRQSAAGGRATAFEIPSPGPPQTRALRYTFPNGATSVDIFGSRGNYLVVVSAERRVSYVADEASVAAAVLAAVLARAPS